MAYTRRTIRKHLLEVNGWEPAQVQSQTSGVIVVSAAADRITPEDLRQLVVGQVSGIGFHPFVLGMGLSGGTSFFRFCTQETVDERSQHGMLDGTDLERFTAAGGVLRDDRSDHAGADVELFPRFQEFLQDPGERFRVRLLRARAAQIRELVADPNSIDLQTFNREIQSRGGGTLLRGQPLDQSLLDGNLSPERAAELEAALDAGEITLAGNYLFDTWSAGFASMDPFLDDAGRLELIQRMLSLLQSVESDPLERVEQVAKLGSIGRTTATSLGALLFPAEVAVSTERVRKVLRSFGYKFSGIRKFEELAQQIRARVGAEDFLQLHRFLEWSATPPVGHGTVRAAFQNFRRDPVNAFLVRVRRVRAEQLRNLISSGRIGLDEFNAEVWRLRGRVDFRGVDVSGLLNPLPGQTVDPARIPELGEGIESGEIELHGNLMWGAGSRVYGPMLNEDARIDGLRRALEIWNDPSLTPLVRATRLMEVPGFGRNIATGLTMVAHPGAFAIYNEASQAGLEKLGYAVGDLEEFEETAEALRAEVGAADFLELDLFLWHMAQNNGVVGHPQRQILKIAPGEQGKYWEECLAGGFICVGWEELDDLRTYGSEQEIRTACLERGSTGNAGIATLYSRALWVYRNLQPGDLVVANRGQSTLLGIGTVVGPYEYQGGRPYYKHMVPVRWDTSCAGPIRAQGPAWRHTIVQLSAEEYRLLIDGADPRPEPFNQLRAELSARGLYFPAELLSNYLLALQAKRFVILTGISGTGKTQLALAVAQHFQPLVNVARPTAVPEDAVEIEVQPYMVKYNRAILPVALMANLELPPADPDDGVFLTVRYPGGKARLRVSDQGSGGAKGLLFKGSVKQWFTDTLEVGDRFLLRPLPGLEAGLDGLEIIIPETEVQPEVLPNHRVVAVRPDWTDNRGLLGYYNPITESYVVTEFLRLLLDARADEQRAGEEGRDPHPFFVILDEMNLARVEHYFSDFLSALESGQPIELHHNPAIEAGEDEGGIAVPRRLEIPRNVFFTGTVNVDETTYMFSPKVLDRAFTLEFNEVDLSGLGADSSDASHDGTGLRLTRLPATLGMLDRPKATDWVALGELLDGELQRVVIELNDQLESGTRHFGYRVANEIGRFVGLAAQQSDDSAESLWAALDLAILQKVLPKFHGTQQELEETLGKLVAFAVAGASGETDGEWSKLADGWRLRRGELVRQQEGDTSPVPRLPRTAAKVWRMLDRVRKQGFTAYVE